MFEIWIAAKGKMCSSLIGFLYLLHFQLTDVLHSLLLIVLIDLL